MSLVAAKDEQPSPVDSMSREEARAGYIVGPPYIATGRDMYKIAKKWTEFAIPVHEQYPYLLAEMFAYCLSAAHQKLAHQTAASFMVSDVQQGVGEGWSYVDKLTADDVCKHHDQKDLPNVLHFCQKYGLGPSFFGKYRLPKNFLTCESPLMVEPLADIAKNHNSVRWPNGQEKSFTDQQVVRNAFMVCQLIPAVNEAAAYFKQNHCGDAGNFNKTLTFIT